MAAKVCEPVPEPVGGDDTDSTSVQVGGEKDPPPICWPSQVNTAVSSHVGASL